jgi:hypothetical protein
MAFGQEGRACKVEVKRGRSYAECENLGSGRIPSGQVSDVCDAVC